MSVSEAYTYIEETSRVTKDEIHFQIDGQNRLLVGMIVLAYLFLERTTDCPCEVRLLAVSHQLARAMKSGCKIE